NVLLCLLCFPFYQLLLRLVSRPERNPWPISRSAWKKVLCLATAIWNLDTAIWRSFGVELQSGDFTQRNVFLFLLCSPFYQLLLRLVSRPERNLWPISRSAWKKVLYLATAIWNLDTAIWRSFGVELQSGDFTQRNVFLFLLCSPFYQLLLRLLNSVVSKHL